MLTGRKRASGKSQRRKRLRVLNQRTRIRMLAICLSRAESRTRSTLHDDRFLGSLLGQEPASPSLSAGLSSAESWPCLRDKTPQNWDRALVTCPTSSVHSAFERFSPVCCRPWRAPRAIADSSSVCYSRASDIAAPTLLLILHLIA